MIVKPTAKFEMPKLKRCKLDEPDDSEGSGESPAVAKKHRVNGFYSLGMPGDGEDFSSGSGSGTSVGSHWGGGGGGEVQSNSNSAPPNGKTAVKDAKDPRPPLLLSSRGRLQMLPSRFSDSVIDPWKNRGIKAAEDGDSSFEDDRAVVSTEGIVKIDMSDSHGLNNSVCYPCPEVKDGQRERADSSGNGRRTVKTESNTSGLSFDGEDQKPDGNVGKRKEIYKPEDFALGDVVWAKCGKRYPAWPAVVIDPILEAPESVLSSKRLMAGQDYAWVK